MLQHPSGPLFAHLGPRADCDAWSERLADAFADRSRTHGFLALAEEAERACPGDPVILCQAAMAALLDRRSDKAQLYLKRYAKRYVPTQSHHLLSALALGLQNKLIPARALLERHGLTNWRDAMPFFPGGWERRFWLDERLDAIMGRERPLRARGPAVRPAAAQALPKSRPPTSPPRRSRRPSRRSRPWSG